VRAAVNCRVCELAVALELLVATICKNSVNSTTNPNPVYSHSYTWQYCSICFGMSSSMCLYSGGLSNFVSLPCIWLHFQFYPEVSVQSGVVQPLTVPERISHIDCTNFTSVALIIRGLTLYNKLINWLIRSLNSCCQYYHMYTNTLLPCVRVISSKSVLVNFCF
jgi:hypothetical protein